MALNLISGKMLQSDLLRDSIDLAFETNLLYLDVTNNRIGVKTNAPSAELDIQGNLNVTGQVQIANQAQIANIIAASNSITSNNGDLIFNSLSGNISVSNKRITNLLDPTANTDAVTKQYLDNALSALNADKIVSDNSALTVFDDGINPGSFDFTLDGNSVATLDSNIFNYQGQIIAGSQITTPTANLGSLIINNDTISDTTGTVNINASTQINLNSSVNISGMGTSRILFVDSAGLIDTNPNFTWDGSNGVVTGSLTVDDVNIDTNSISSVTAGLNINTAANGSLIISTGTGIVDINTTSAIQLPAGLTTQRPTTPTAGMTRWNSANAEIEYYDGTTWQSTQRAFSVTSQQIIPDGVSTSYTLNKSATTDGVLVTVNGIVQDPEGGAVYSVTGTTITFTSVLQPSDVVSIRFLEP